MQTSPYSTSRRATALRRKCSDSTFDIRCCGVAGAHDTRDPAAPASPARSGTVHIQRPGSTWTLESPRGSAGGVFCWRWTGCVETALVLACLTYGRIWGLIHTYQTLEYKSWILCLGRSFDVLQIEVFLSPKIRNKSLILKLRNTQSHEHHDLPPRSHHRSPYYWSEAHSCRIGVQVDGTLLN